MKHARVFKRADLCMIFTRSVNWLANLKTKFILFLISFFANLKTTRTTRPFESCLTTYENERKRETNSEDSRRRSTTGTSGSHTREIEHKWSVYNYWKTGEKHYAFVTLRTMKSSSLNGTWTIILYLFIFT